MTLTSTNNSVSVFKDRKLKPGIYKIQNFHSQTYADILEYPREPCCWPAASLKGKGLVGFCPCSAHIVTTVLTPAVSSGKFSLLVLDILYAGCSIEIHFASIAVHWTMLHSSNQGGLTSFVPHSATAMYQLTVFPSPGQLRWSMRRPIMNKVTFSEI